MLKWLLVPFSFIISFVFILRRKNSKNTIIINSTEIKKRVLSPLILVNRPFSLIARVWLSRREGTLLRCRFPARREGPHARTLHRLSAIHHIHADRIAVGILREEFAVKTAAGGLAVHRLRVRFLRAMIGIMCHLLAFALLGAGHQRERNQQYSENDYSKINNSFHNQSI